jgi:RND family efflux transporter MFP subunit
METSSALVELGSVFFACRDRDTLLKTFAARTATTLGARAAFLWLAQDKRNALLCRARWTEPGERLAPVGDPVTEGILVSVIGTSSVLRVAGADLDRGQFGQFPAEQRSAIQSALYAPLPGPEAAVGVVEVVNKRGAEFTAADAAFLEAAARLAAQAYALFSGIEEERHTQLATLERLTALYDLGRTFTSTLELEELLPIVAGKIRDILGGRACNLWLIDSAAGVLKLARQAGEDPTVREGAREKLGSGLLGEVAHTGNPRLVESPAEEASYAARVKAGGGFAIHSVICAPLRKEDEVIGVVELVNKLDGSAFDENDLFFLSSVSEQAGVALHNANLLESERKVHQLDALLKISQEITSTLDLGRVLTTVVHQAGTAVPFDRCVIGFFDRGRFLLGAVSGETEVPKTSEMDSLRKLLEWVATQEAAVRADQLEAGWRFEPDGARAVLLHFLEERGYAGFYALPLRDDQGTVGVLALLSGEAEFLSESQRETLAILASQTTVAVRNAQLYQQVPLAGLLHPFAAKKKKVLEALPFAHWWDYAGKAGLVAAALVVLPWPMRVSTDATVVPAERRVVTAHTGGIVQRVLVREGDAVARGQLLAQLDDSEDRVKLSRAETELALARRDLAEAEFRRDLTAAAQARLRSSLHQAEIDLERERVAQAQLRALIDGVVVTPKVEEKTGVMLQPGDTFCELVEQQRMAVDMTVPETDLSLIRPGKHVSLKLNAFPTVTFAGTVERIGARARSSEGEQFFLVRAVFENAGGRARDGMVGRVRVRAGGGWFGSGWYPVGFVFLRTPFRWAWEKVWVWLP